MFPVGEELKLFQIVAARFNFLSKDFLNSVKEFTRKVVPPTEIALSSTKLKGTHSKTPEGLEKSMDPIGQQH